MADVKWTAEQEQVINTRNRNLLVSAAAGSGKTAVLVERIIRMVTDPEKPVDIDRLLVMTFTNAAASEMRQRVGDALEKRLEDMPGDRNLERQASLIHHAQITTIDSFCLKLLREHFNELDIDPGFRIGDEGELLLLQADVMKELLEDYYGRNDERFLRFVDTYASGKADGGLEDYILQVWRFSQSNPWPGEWIGACKREFREEEAGNPESFENTEWMKFLTADVRKQTEEFICQLNEAIEISEEEDGPQAYLPMLQEDRNSLKRLFLAETYPDICRVLSEPMFGRLAAVRKKEIDPEKKERAASLRNRVKDGIKKMKALYIPGDPEQVYSDLLSSREPVFMLLELAEEFSARYQEAKEEKNMVDFNDLEHFALDILTGGSRDHSPGAAADELAMFYEEILVDEYQDSNEVQETLIRLISRERYGTPNVFMVGDVKQSIYKFRLAKPELFLEKYESYGKEDGFFQKIELHKNFRSRPEVLSGINDIFYSIMTKELGDIRYTEDAALHAGAAYPGTLLENQAKTEVLLLDMGDEAFLAMDEEKADYTGKEAEARLIAAKIKELTHPETGMKIWNGKSGQYEPLKRKDIVILLRSLAGWAEEFLSVLGAEGILAFAESRTGYFTAPEVETVLNMLAVIDNPMQDIPLAGVLKSPIGGLTDRELAMIMAEFKGWAEKGQDGGLYGAVRHFLDVGETVFGGSESFKKLEKFWGLLLDLRKEAEYLPVHRLIYRIFQRTGYDDYVSAMPAGKVRQGNLSMLVEKAEAFEKTSYQSLFDFIRYIERLRKYNTDFGEASGAGDDSDMVRIMSIHKSKGLEFPVVFLAGAGKSFNRQDSRGKILIDERLGIATDFMDLDRKVKTPTLKKNVLSRRMNLESMGEELRVLYVAMTRAREKLIITAADKYLENRLEKWGNISETGALPFTYLSNAGSYLDWILMASGNTKDTVSITRIPAGTLIQAEAENQAEKAGTYMELKKLMEAPPIADERLEEMLSFRYPCQADISLHAKMSVSELKARGQFVDDGDSGFLPTIPRFLREEDEMEEGAGDMGGEGERSSESEKSGESEKHGSGGESRRGRKAEGGVIRGTAYHRALELLSFKDIWSYEDVKKQLGEIGEKKRMDRSALAMVNAWDLWDFFRTPAADRMRKADQKGKLHKEGQFVMGVPAADMDLADSDELVLVQGIIDAWFEEEDGIVLVDYKTDRIREGEEKVLLDRYSPQMVYYQRALEQITGKKVKESILYSLTLKKQISVF